MKITDKMRLDAYRVKFKKENRPKWALCRNSKTFDHETMGNCTECLNVSDAAIRASRKAGGKNGR